jgi:hypothetical protein
VEKGGRKMTVKCINNDRAEEFLTVGRKYLVSVENDGRTYKIHECDNGTYMYASASRFKEVTTPLIQKVIYNPPATIIIWDDGTKTIAKCDEHDTYNAEKGLLICMAKKAYGGKMVREEMDKWKVETKTAEPKKKIVVCVGNTCESELTIGKEYEAKKEAPATKTYYIKDDRGEEHWYYKSRFVDIEEQNR